MSILFLSHFARTCYVLLPGFPLDTFQGNPG